VSSPVTIEVRYLHGKAHGTPWSASHNEGRVEFPPSPWRILRALVCTGFERAFELDPEAVRRCISRLADAPPSYLVPPFRSTHVRHWMPDAEHQPVVKHSTSRVLDAFAVLDRGTPLIVEWPIELDDEDRHVLGVVASRMPYLGRADAPVEARLLARDEAPQPVKGAARVSPGALENVDLDAGRLLCARSPLDWDGLIQIPWKLRQKGYVLPPAALEIQYVAEAPLRWEPPRRTRHRPAEAARWIEWTIGARGSVPLTAAVAFTDVLRTQVIKRLDGSPPSAVTGKGADGRPLSNQHRHAHFLPVSANGRELTGLAMWIPEGIDEELVERIARVDGLRWVGDRTPRRRFEPDSTGRDGSSDEGGDSASPSAPSAIGGQRDFRGVRLFLQQCGSRPTGPEALKLVGPSTQWSTLTPFVPTRHRNRHQSDAEHLALEVARECTYRGLPTPASVEIIRGTGFDARRFRRHRVTERLGDERAAFHLAVSFPAPVTGPIALGGLSHYGLGLLIAAPEGSSSGRSAAVRTY
jgi:CRISPR-associated protein Csb2